VKVTFGLKAHSGWAALVVVGMKDGDLVVVDRRRLDLVEEAWAKQPCHAAEALEAAAALALVERGIEAAHRIAAREMRAAVRRERDRDNTVAACAVLVAEPMPGWTTAEILAVHFRMHKAEGVLFRDALVRAARACRLKPVPIHEKSLMEQAVRLLGGPPARLVRTIAGLGKSVGPPWGKDQKDAALAALIALQDQEK
jgi:hypothetical protein